MSKNRQNKGIKRHSANMAFLALKIVKSGSSAVLSICIISIVTYIHNWPLQRFSQDYGLASHTTHVVGVNFIREWRDLQFNVDSER